MLRFWPPSCLSILVSSCISATSTSPLSLSLTVNAYYRKRRYVITKKKYMKENFEGEWTKTRSSFYLGLCGETQLPVIAQKKDIAAFTKRFEPRSYIYLFRIWSSGRNESWEGLLVVTDVSTSWVEVIFLDSEGDFRSGWWNVSHHQQSFARLISPERSNSTLAQLDFPVACITCGFCVKVSSFITHPPADNPDFHSLLCLKRCHRLDRENHEVFITWHIVAFVK